MLVGFGDEMLHSGVKGRRLSRRTVTGAAVVGEGVLCVVLLLFICGGVA